MEKSIVAFIFITIFLLLLASKACLKVTRREGFISRVEGGQLGDFDLMESILRGNEDEKKKKKKKEDGNEQFQLPVAENNPNFPNPKLPSFIADEQGILTAALTQMVVDSIDFTNPVQDKSNLSGIEKIGESIDPRKDKPKLSNLLSQGSVPLLIDFPADELDYVTLKIMRLLNKNLEPLNRSYGILQIQGKNKEKIPGTPEGVFKYTLNLYISEKHKFFAQIINVVFDLRLPNAGGGDPVMKLAQIAETKTGDPLQVEYEDLDGDRYGDSGKEIYRIPQGFFGHDISRNLGHDKTPIKDLGGSLLSNEDIQLEEARRMKVRQLAEEFQCFGSFNIGAKTKAECEKSNGKWDRPVQNDNECPYFRANKNYENNRGGARGTGYCEIPLGAQLVGYRNISANPEYKPLCYNCKSPTDPTVSGVGRCCDEQALDRGMYPLLDSPDYVFGGDILDRGHVVESLQLQDRSLNSDRTVIPETAT